MGLFGCDYLETRGTFFPEYHCKYSKQQLEKHTAEDICMTSRYTDCADYKNASRCFITTAVCLTMGKSDDCEELVVMRSFRDDWLRHQPGGPDQVEDYYRTAPAIVERIDAEPGRREIYCHLYEQYILPCVKSAKRGSFEESREIYSSMVDSLKGAYLESA